MVQDGGGEFKREGLFAASLLGGRRGGVCGGRFGAWRGAEDRSFGRILCFAAIVGALLRIGGFRVGAIVSENDEIELDEGPSVTNDCFVWAAVAGGGGHGLWAMVAAAVSVELCTPIASLLRGGGIVFAYGGAAEVAQRVKQMEREFAFVSVRKKSKRCR